MRCWFWQHHLTPAGAGRDTSKPLNAFFWEAFIFFSLLISDTFCPFITSTISPRQFAVGCFFFFLPPPPTWDENQYERSRAHVKDHSLEYLIFSLQQHWCNYGNKFPRWTGMRPAPDKSLSCISRSQLPQHRRSLYRLLLHTMIASSFFCMHILYGYYSAGRSLVNKAEWNLIYGADTQAEPG